MTDLVARLLHEGTPSDDGCGDTLKLEAAARIAVLEKALGDTVIYLDELQANMLTNDVDMLLDTCKAPEIVAGEIRAALTPTNTGRE